MAIKINTANSNKPASKAPPASAPEHVAGGGVSAKHLEDNQHLYAPGVLVPEVHYRLVQNMPEISRVAGVPATFISQSMTELCSDSEVDWVRHIFDHPQHNRGGLVYVGCEGVHKRMMALCGALLRNYIDARVRMAQSIVDDCKQRQPTQATVVACPNFYRSKKSGGDIPSWDVAHLYGWLYDRYARQQQTVLFVQSLEGLRTDYGSGVYDLIADSYVRIEK